MEKEFAHYVVTAHQPGAVLVTARCNFLAPDSLDVLVAKSRRLEIRQLRPSDVDGTDATALAYGSDNAGAAAAAASPFPIVLQVPINGRITCLAPLQLPSMATSCVFVATHRLEYAVLCYDPSDAAAPYPVRTLCSGSLRGDQYGTGDGSGTTRYPPGQAAVRTDLAPLAESGPLVAVDPGLRCIALHVYEGLVSFLPIQRGYEPPPPAAAASAAAATARSQLKGSRDDDDDNGTGSGYRARPSSLPRTKPSAAALFGPMVHCRVEERIILDMTFLHAAAADADAPQLVLLHQDARGGQHVMTHVVQLPGAAATAGRAAAGGGSLKDNSGLAVLQGGGALKKSHVDGGSSLLIAVPPRAAPAAAAAAGAGATSETAAAPAHGGVVILGQRQFTFFNGNVTKVVPVPQALFLCYEALPPDPATQMPRYLIADEFGNLHLLTLILSHSLPAPGAAASTASGSAAAGSDKVVALNFETLGSCALASSLTYLREGLVYVGSTLGDSQLVQIHDEPIAVPLAASEGAYGAGGDGEGLGDDVDAALMDTTYLSVIEEYTNLGPILDFDLIPTTPGTTVSESTQCQVVTASGSSKTGSLRLVRNGIGMNEYASVEIPGIQDMWSVRESFDAPADKYLVQSFVGETRVLGVVASSEDRMEEDASDEAAASLEEVIIPGLESAASSLYVGNVVGGDLLLQITESEIRLFSSTSGHILDQCPVSITVAAANEAGQIAVSIRGGLLAYYCIDESNKIVKIDEKQMEREISCLDIHPFTSGTGSDNNKTAMDIDEPEGASRVCKKSNLVAVGLWDDFTVRLIRLGPSLEEALCISLGNDDEGDEDEGENVNVQRRHINNMMARSLCLVTLDFNSSIPGAAAHSYSRGVNMLLVGLGDGTLISFAVVFRNDGMVIQAKKEVCLGTQRVGLVPLNMEGRGTCVLATGDRPTVIYLAGVGGASSTQFNPKLCYSNVNLSSNEEDEDGDISRSPSQTIAVNVATPFFSPELFDAGAFGSQHYPLCIADDKNLKLGIIDDIQKLHVTTCRIGMAPRRVAHCPDGRLFAVGCVESGITHIGLGEQEQNMQNCIRFMDDTTFDDLERIDLEPFEMIMSMCYAALKLPSSGEASDAMGADGELASAARFKPFLLVGTAYALPDEDEPTRGRILVYSFQEDESSAAASNSSRCVRLVTELATQGAVYSITQFYEGKLLCSVNSKTFVAQLADDAGLRKLQFMGIGHHGHILSLVVRSLAKRMQTDPSEPDVAVLNKAASMDIDKDDDKKKATESAEMLAIVGDLMRSISLVQYFPDHDILEEIAKDFNANWITAIEMLNDRVYLGAENWNNLICLRRNVSSQSEEIRCRLDNIGEFHLGEMVNKFVRGSLVMPLSASLSSGSEKQHPASAGPLRSPQMKQVPATPTKRDGTVARGSSSPPGTGKATPTSSSRSTRRPVVVTGSQTLFGTVEGTLGVILGMDGRTAAFFGTLERALASAIRPVGDFSHARFRAVEAQSRMHGAHGFIDGDLVESFLDLDRSTMQAVADEMNRDGGWEIDDSVMLQKAGHSEKKDDDPQIGEEDTERPELTVDDILAMVEEITMLH